MNKAIEAADHVVGRSLRVDKELNDDKLEILIGHLQAALMQCPESKFYRLSVEECRWLAKEK